MPSSRVPSSAVGSMGCGGCRGWQCCCVGQMDIAEGVGGECGEVGNG